MPRVGGRAVQMEDEIASISAIIGASFGGEKVITATSGPGLQLMGEQLNLAAMIELPIVIVDVQSGGPSTGLPTKTEQSDLKFAVYGTTGDSPRVVLAPATVEDCFYQTMRAFNLSERFQVPVIILSDQSIGFRKATVRLPDFAEIREVEWPNIMDSPVIPSATEDRAGFADRTGPGGDGELPEVPGHGRRRSRPSPGPGRPAASTWPRASSTRKTDTRTIRRKSTTDDRQEVPEARRLVQGLFEKNPPEYYGSRDAKIGVIGWGSTEGRHPGGPVHGREARACSSRHLHPKVISPLPDRQIRYFLAELKHVIIVEENYTGQFAHFVSGKFGIRPIELHKCQGLPMTSREVFTSIMKVARIVDEQNIAGL